MAGQRLAKQVQYYIELNILWTTLTITQAAKKDRKVIK